MKKIFGGLVFSVLLCSCQDEEMKTSGANSNESSDVVFELNADALYSDTHTISSIEAEKFAVKAANALRNGKNNGLKSGKTLKVNSITAVGFPKGGLKSYSASARDTLAYIVNFANNNGWAYISADDRVGDPLLAVFEQGNYDPKTIAEVPGLKELMDNADSYMINEIKTFEKYKDFAKTNCPNTLKRKKKDVIKTYSGTYEELYDLSCFREVTTTWGQDGKYSAYCEKCSSHPKNVCATGCVNTAQAQILAYWERPAVVNGYSMNWSAMKADRSIDNVSSSAQSQIGHLMRELGRINNTEYHCANSPCKGSGSNRFSSGIQSFMKNNGYNCFMTKINKTNPGPEIISNLKTYNSPICISSGGHHWIIDGYRVYSKHEYTMKINVTKEIFISQTDKETVAKNTYLHHNWGWKGVGNGYFAKNVYQPNKADYYDYSKSSESNNFAGSTDFYIINYLPK